MWIPQNRRKAGYLRIYVRRYPGERTCEAGGLLERIPVLKQELFVTDGAYAQVKAEDLKVAISENRDVVQFRRRTRMLFPI